MKADPTCAYCGKPGVLHRDHVVPRSRGGPDNATNVVMACQVCNSAKGDQLPSEWLGDRCPAAVLLIEARVHAKLRKSFSKRDRKPEPEPLKLFVFYPPKGYAGEVISETADTVRVELADGFMFVCGLWSLSGEIRDLPKAECRLFSDRDACAHAVSVAMRKHERSRS